MWPHHGIVEGEDHLLQPAGHTHFHASQDTICFLGHKGTLLTHGQPVVHQNTQVLLLRALLQQLIPKPILILMVIPSNMQDSTLASVEPHLVCCSALQFVQVLLNGSTALRCVSHSSQLCITGMLTKGGHYPLIKDVDEDIEQDHTQH